MLDWVEIVLFIIYFLLDHKDGDNKWRYKELREKRMWRSRIKKNYSNLHYSTKRKRW